MRTTPIRTRADLEGRDRESVTIEGLYRVVDLGRHAVIVQRDGKDVPVRHSSNVLLDDGTTIRLGPRFEDEHALDGMRVRVTGRLIEAGPRIASTMAMPDPAHTLVDIVEVVACDA